MDMEEQQTNAKHGYHHGDLRRALIRAAEEELTEKGPEGFTLRGCAKRAGVSHAAPAHHFGDAAGLLSALAAEGFERFLAAMEKRVAAAPPDDAEARMIGSGLGYIDFARDNPALFRLMFSSKRPDYSGEHLQSAASASFRHLVEGVAGIAGPNPLTTPEGRLRVAAVWSMAHGLADLIQTHRMKFLAFEDEEDRDRNLSAILRVSLMS